MCCVQRWPCIPLCFYLPSVWQEWKCLWGSSESHGLMMVEHRHFQSLKYCLQGAPHHPAVIRERYKCLLCLSHYTEPRLSFTAVSLPYLIINVIRMSLYVSIKDRNSSFALKGKIPQNGQPQNSYDSLPSPPRRPSSEARCGCLPGAPVYL